MARRSGGHRTCTRSPQVHLSHVSCCLLHSRGISDEIFLSMFATCLNAHERSKPQIRGVFLRSRTILILSVVSNCLSANEPELSQAKELEKCARLILERQGGDELMSCRRPLLKALLWDAIPGYSYNASDCFFWTHFAARDRSVEGSSDLDFNIVAEHRLSEPFVPPLRTGGLALYIGAHRTGEDGVHFHKHHSLKMHLFEPSPSFFRDLYMAVGNLSGFILHNYGLGSRNQQLQLLLSGTGSKTFEGENVGMRGPSEPVLVRSTSEVMADIYSGEHAHADLLHINCEGCEYDVIPSLKDSGHLTGMAQVQIATHLLERPGPTFHESLALSMHDSVNRYCEMHRVLSETHYRVWGLPWVWERWTRRS